VAIAGTTFFIPFLTPRYFESSECRQELLKRLCRSNGRRATVCRESAQEPAAKIQALGEQYTSELMTVHGMSSTILETAESSPELAEEVAPYLRSLVELDDSAAGAVESTRGLVRTMQDNAKLSRSLRPPTRQIATGLQAFVDGGAIIREWADRARRLLKDMDSPD
jgi:hypothetical protein